MCLTSLRRLCEIILFNFRCFGYISSHFKKRLNLKHNFPQTARDFHNRFLAKPVLKKNLNQYWDKTGFTGKLKIGLSAHFLLRRAVFKYFFPKNKDSRISIRNCYSLLMKLIRKSICKPKSPPTFPFKTCLPNNFPFFTSFI